MEARNCCAVNRTSPSWHLQLHEALYLALGGALALALMVRHGAAQELTLGVMAATIAYAGVMFLSQKGERVRLVAAALATWLVYGGSSSIIEALRLPLRSAQFLAWDTWLCGVTPAASWQGGLPPWTADVFSAAYLSYQVYVHWAYLSAWCLVAARRMEFMRGVFTTFAVGFSAYFLLPAATPAVAFPELFAAPVQGGVITAFNEMLNLRVAARYDAFPSMHVLVTMTLLAWDWSHYRVRFWIMMAPAALMAAGTLYLRLHYFVDLAASAVLFGLLQSYFRWKAGNHVALSHAAAS